MKVYQPVAVGHLEYGGARHIAYSEQVYRKEKDAEAAIPEFRKLLTTPKSKEDHNYMTDNPLRIFIKVLEVK